MLTERLDHHRGRGQQQIVVKHVTVNADQAMVAETITTGTCGAWVRLWPTPTKSRARPNVGC
jgi:hypothetical protein